MSEEAKTQLIQEILENYYDCGVYDSVESAITAILDIIYIILCFKEKDNE